MSGAATRRALCALACWGAALTLTLGACSLKVPGPNAAGSEEGIPCEQSDSCPVASEPCLLSMCLDGQCVFTPAPDGVLPAADQKAGDCRQLYCDTEGQVVPYPALADIPADDGNPCTEAICDQEIPKQVPTQLGSRCGEDGLCNGQGVCGVCLPEERRCDGAAVITCSQEGQWSTAAACATGKPVCSEGHCLGVVEVSAGGEHLCARFENGSVRCWGADDRGQLGDGGTETSTAPALTGFARVVLGERHGCALRSDGSVWCWGANDFGQLGIGSYDSTAVPSQVVGLGDVVELALGRDHSCARSRAGEVSCWGRNDRGQLGSGKPPREPLPASDPPDRGRATPEPKVIDGLSDASSLLLGADATCVRRRAGLRCWGLEPYALPAPPISADPDADPPDAETRQAFERLEKASSNKPVPVSGLASVASIAAGADHSCAALDDQTVRCWGANDAGQSRGVAGKDAFAATVVATVRAGRGLALGERFGCALDASGLVSCWGANDEGQLGGGSEGDHDSPHPIAALGPARSVLVGDSFACAWLDSGELSCWGSNRLGQLSSSTVDVAREPQRVSW